MPRACHGACLDQRVALVDAGQDLAFATGDLGFPELARAAKDVLDSFLEPLRGHDPLDRLGARAVRLEVDPGFTA